MSKGRKNGCPLNIKDWLVYIQDKAQSAETWLRIFGLTSLNRTTGSTTEDGSSDTELWEEPYVTKRNAKITLKGRPVVDAGTGDEDAGQEMLNSYANDGGDCYDDCTLKLVDPYGHAMVADYIVTDTSNETDDTNNEVSWDLQQVGEAEMLPYIQMGSIALKNGESALSSLSKQVGDAGTVVTVVFTPATASNKRFRVSVSGRKFVSISDITENGFTVNALAAGTANVTVTSVNGGKTASFQVTVTNPS